MLLSKSLALLTAPAALNVMAFSVENGRPLRIRNECPMITMPTNQLQPHHRSFHQSLKVSKLSNEGEMRTITSGTVDPYIESTLAPENTAKDEVPTSVSALVGSSLLGFSFVLHQLQEYLNTPCLTGATVCTETYKDFSQFYLDHSLLSFVLVLTHAIPFVLLPWVSKQISVKGPLIKEDFEGFSPFLSKQQCNDFYQCG